MRQIPAVMRHSCQTDDFQHNITKTNQKICYLPLVQGTSSVYEQFNMYDASKLSPDVYLSLHPAYILQLLLTAERAHSPLVPLTAYISIEVQSDRMSFIFAQ